MIYHFSVIKRSLCFLSVLLDAIRNGHEGPCYYFYFFLLFFYFFFRTFPKNSIFSTPQRGNSGGKSLESDSGLEFCGTSIGFG